MKRGSFRIWTNGKARKISIDKVYVWDIMYLVVSEKKSKSTITLHRYGVNKSIEMINANVSPFRFALNRKLPSFCDVQFCDKTDEGAVVLKKASINTGLIDSISDVQNIGARKIFSKLMNGLKGHASDAYYAVRFYGVSAGKNEWPVFMVGRPFLEKPDVQRLLKKNKFVL